MFYGCKVIDNSVFTFKFETGFYNCNLDFWQMLKKLFGEERNNLAIYFDSFKINYGCSWNKKLLRKETKRQFDRAKS